MAESNPKISIPAPYPMVEPDIKKWPIYQISRNKKQLIEDVIQEAMQVLYKPEAGQSLKLVADACYQERIRIEEDPWKVDPPDEKAFFKAFTKEIQTLALGEGLDQEAEKALLEKLIRRYTLEIVGDFRMPTYKLAKRAVNYGFSGLFNTFSRGFFQSQKKQQRELVNRLKITGEIDQIRELAKKGTLLLVPTHFSNLDSVIIGWALQAIGLPPFTYGAGINLFGHPALSFFMNRLGAFRVDRRKKNRIYLSVLKVYTEHVIRKGANTLFFPGGTRSRSGGIETRLKLGLLGTAIEAQRKLILENEESPRQIYVVPLVMSYHNVLEAQSLIDQHMKREGKEQYVIVKDDFRSLNKTLKFIWNFTRGKSKMIFSFGKPMDLFGNHIDGEGNSIDQNGNRLDIGDYYRSNGEITFDAQRSKSYTRLLGDEILKHYHRDNIVFNSHLVAFAAFEYFLQSQKVDLFRLFTKPQEDLKIKKDVFHALVDRLLTKLKSMSDRGLVKLADHLKGSTEDVIREGLHNLQGYHVVYPLGQKSSGDIYTPNLKLLYFYHNRLNGYELHRFIL